jgi:hypothetical protein
MRDKRGARVRRLDGGRPMDYTAPADMHAAAQVQAARRGGADHEYVVGCFRLVDGVVVLAAVARGAAWSIPDPPCLTVNAAAFARWRTKQAAWQWLPLRPGLDAHVIHLGRLDVLPAAAAAP